MTKSRKTVQRKEKGNEGRGAVRLQPADANIHAREYQLYLPSKEVLRQKLVDWVREQEVAYDVRKVL